MSATTSIDNVKTEYEARILAFLRQCAKACRDAGLVVTEPADMSDDDYRWAFTAYRSTDRDLDSAVDVTLQIAEAREYGDEPESGINFGLDIVEFGGRILGGFAPHNYTEQCWIDAGDAEAVESRWGLFESVDVAGVPEQITNRKDSA